MASNESLIFFGVTAITSTLIFSTLGYCSRSKAKKQTNKPPKFDLMERSGKRIALSSPSIVRWLMGLIYAALFYYSLPFLIWRYGKTLPLLFIATPYALSIALTSLIAPYGGGGYLLGIVLKVIFRAFVGLYIVANDSKFYRNVLISRGWKLVGSCEAASKKCAMNYSPA